MNTEINDLVEKNDSEIQQQESRGTENAYKEKIGQLMEVMNEKDLRRLWLITAVMVGYDRKESKDI